MNYGQVIDSFTSRGEKLVTVWDIALKRRFTVVNVNDLQIRDLVGYNVSEFSDKCPETGVSNLRITDRLPAGLKPLI
jgi:hypothetical protein